MRIAITGHQHLDDNQSWEWVDNRLREEIEILDNPVIGISSLAIGADQYFARQILARHGSLYAVIPFEDYERTFSQENLASYYALLKSSKSVEFLTRKENDEESYLAAGKRVVELSDTVIAVWNGLPSKGTGGTADIVAYAHQLGLPLIHINPANRTVTNI